jgi:phage antirepressor YoqD-like protein
MAFYHKKISSIEALKLEKERLKLELQEKSLKNLITVQDVKSSMQDEFAKKDGAFSFGAITPLLVNIISGSGLAEMAVGYALRRFSNRRNKKQRAENKLHDAQLHDENPKQGKSEKLIDMLIKGVEGIMNLQKVPK